MDLTKYEVPVDKLRWRCDPDIFDFECTKDLAPLREFIGQDRAIRAIEFGLAMNHDGYNIYVAGLTGTGKTSIVRRYIEKLVEQRRAGERDYKPQDWCYLYNFTEPDRPQVLALPQGKGRVFRDRMVDLLKRLKEELSKAFSSEEYQSHKKRIVEQNQAEQQKLFQAMEEDAQRQGFMLQMTPMGPVAVPVSEGKPMSQEDYMALEEPLRKQLESRRADVIKRLEVTFERARELQRELVERLQGDDKAIADVTVSRLFETVSQEYRELAQVSQYLADLKSYTLTNLEVFKQKEEQEPSLLGMPPGYIGRGDPFIPFHVNVFVDNTATEGPPVVVEPNPNYSNLFGKVERRFLLGGYMSDHTLLKPGALHLANGGYLLLSAKDVLMYPAVWLALKRAIKTRELRIEDPFEAFGLTPPQGMRPQPMPIDVKIVLIGDAWLYQALSFYDEDFWEIFKVKSDFNFEVERNKDNMISFAAFIAGCCEDCELHHFDRTGVARVIEYASRMVSDQEKLSSRFAQIRELVQEAEHWARRDGASLVAAEHVDRAVDERTFRHNLPDERMREMIGQGTILIDTEGAVVGQVNGLSVYSLGDAVFGKPSRITCKTFLGRNGVVNIERESKLSGSIHDKGVLILSGYLGWKYAQDTPLSLSASLCFEQSYEGVEGDSASSSELYALLSSISGLPIGQNIAVTGSVNQKGEIQPVGGINHKIEGFYEVCKARGLDGSHGVMIPRQNVRNLMLKDEVASAVRENKFRIYAVGTIDEGLEVLTGVEAGEKKEDGAYPEGTFNYEVDRNLKEMADKLRHYQAPGEPKRETQG